jgi:uncharacterized membrane protein YsdA (DUF1294 family)
MDKIVKEITVFILFAYLAVWLSTFLLFGLDLRSSSAQVSQIEEVFLIQLSIVAWFVSMIGLYVFRLLFFFLMKKLNPAPESGAP